MFGIVINAYEGGGYIVKTTVRRRKVGDRYEAFPRYAGWVMYRLETPHDEPELMPAYGGVRR